jgi:hypothetical protein
MRRDSKWKSGKVEKWKSKFGSEEVESKFGSRKVEK